MAQALKTGDLVTVGKTLRFKRDSPEYQAGFKSVRVGQIGQVVGAAQGRFVVVDFKGRQATIASRRLERAEPPEQPQKPERSVEPANAVRAVEKPAVPAYYASPAFITFLTNKLLLTGNFKSEAETVIQMRLDELPYEVQQQIQALIQAKLDLSPAMPAMGANGAHTKRRGRKSKLS